MTVSHPDIGESLLKASQVAIGLVHRGLRVAEVRIQGRARPAVQVRPTRSMAFLGGSRYAWGRDAYGRFERYATCVDGVQVQWELRPRSE